MSVNRSSRVVTEHVRPGVGGSGMVISLNLVATFVDRMVPKKVRRSAKVVEHFR